MTLADLLARLASRAQESERIGATAPVAAVLRDVAAELAQVDGAPAVTPNAPASGFWSCPPETRIVGVQALADSTGLSIHWLYRRTARIPHARIDGVLLFHVGEVREWLLEQAVEVRAPAVVVTRRARRIAS